MEGVEDIPGTALHEGIRWSWETFPEYLDALEAMPRAIDVGPDPARSARSEDRFDNAGMAGLRRRRDWSMICDASMPTFMLAHWVRGRR